MLLNLCSCFVFSLFVTFSHGIEDASSSSSSEGPRKQAFSDGDLILRRYCKRKPDSPLCGFVVNKNTETVFPPNSNSIVHTRSERDDSESYLPITQDDLTDGKTATLFSTQEESLKRKKRYMPYGMMGGYGGYPGMGYGGYPGMGYGGYPGFGYGHGMGFGMGHGMGFGYGHGLGIGGEYGGPFGIRAHRGFGVMTPIGPIGAYRSFSLGFG